jgi:hypothetical protein
MSKHVPRQRGDSRAVPLQGSTAREIYAHVDRSINDRLGVTMGWTALLAAEPYSLDAETVAGHRARYTVIRRAQQQVLDLFKASLEGEADPEIAKMVVGDAQLNYGVAYHRALTEQQHRTPVFFRTDEMYDGKVTEIQCSGCSWGLAEQLRDLYEAYESTFGPAVHFPESLSSQFAQALRGYLGTDPVVHHLVDNASRPHGMNYFIQRLRDQGVPHLYYDGEIHPRDCNFIRAHDFISLPTHNFFKERMERCNRGEVLFDLPPSCLFDGKIIMAWPFWQKTRDAFDDEVRSLFPYTYIVEPSGVVLADGERVTIEEFCAIPRRKRKYYIKYAGTDVAINWGSKGVYLATHFSEQKCREMMDRVLADREHGRYWIIQESIRQSEPVVALERNDELTETDAYSKLSGFYGPDGLMAILVMHLRSHKVHGTAESILSLVY